MTLNKVHLVGRAGRDPEVKYFESGSVVCKFTVAINRVTSNRDEPPDWFDLEAWGKTAEIASNYVKKGSLVGVVGSLKFDRWNDRSTGEERQKSVILIDRLELLGSRKDNEAASNSSYDDDF
ncbi:MULTISPECIES: single-stranded DNA-binding protein [Pseudanabaena]|uniref:Single-stranded DNA-binding protein n=2 Tax=Pseudanabaena TaxID=1152 RepID=L8N4C3_9CYAN|nr:MULTISPECIES: single-stranded DNA-binding protein [Pseudanabaena]ELS34521.1 single-strand binding protein [Pseudanabaena biceps PCC 7429]MDG3493292.1 single-stranded DNA-binding protein [Pseudanabaena catenata USMAC16]